MTGIGALLSDRDRRELLARVRRIEELAALCAEPGGQRPPPVPPALAVLAARGAATGACGTAGCREARHSTGPA